MNSAFCLRQTRYIKRKVIRMCASSVLLHMRRFGATVALEPGKKDNKTISLYVHLHM